MENASSRDCCWTRPREFSFDIVLWCAYNIDKGNACSNKRSPGIHPHGCPKTLSTQDEKTLIERAVCPKQTAYFFIPYLSHRYSTKARMLETEPKTPIASLILEVICTTLPQKIFPARALHATQFRTSREWWQPSFWTKTKQWIPTKFKVAKKPTAVKKIDD